MGAKRACVGSHKPARTARPSLELADIVREHRPAYTQKYGLTHTESAVLSAIERCRTAALGGHVDVCLDCGHERPSYNSCHNRHCPKCPAVAQAKWIGKRLERVLPTHCFHVVFTLPSELRSLCFGHPRLGYDLLFRCAAETLLTLGRDDKRLGGELGITMVLHTWSRDLSYHPHVHCIVTGGALTSAGRWRKARPNYLFPVRVLGKLFRGKMLAALRRAHHDKKLRGRDEPRFFALLAKLYKKNWLVYCKRPFGGPDQVIRYLGQYTHRVAISNHRFVSMDARGVTFRTRSENLVTLDGVTFLRRWLQHILPPRFVKIRHFGLMAAAHAKTRLEVARAELQRVHPRRHVAPQSPKISAQATLPTTWRELITLLTGVDLGICSCCGSRQLHRTALPRAPPHNLARVAA